MEKWVVVIKETTNSKLEATFKSMEYLDQWEMVVMFAP
jgi:hypothetical protein